MHLNLRPFLPQDPRSSRPAHDAPLSMDGHQGRRVAERPAERRRDDAQERRQRPDRRQPERPTGEAPLSRAVIALAATLAALDLAAPPGAPEPVSDKPPEAASFDFLLAKAVG